MCSVICEKLFVFFIKTDNILIKRQNIYIYIKEKNRKESPMEELTTFLHLNVLIIASYYYCLQNFPNSPISFIACLFYTCYLNSSDLVVTTLYTLHIVIVTTFYLILLLSQHWC